MNISHGSARRKQDAPSAEDADRSNVQHLLHHLIQQVIDNHTPAMTLAESGGQEIIFDEEVDGIRCLLLRPPVRDERAQVMLSPREQEIARMVAEGYPNKTIAAVLDISAWTVCTHLRRIFAKLNVRSRAAMVARLLEERLIKDRSKPYDLRAATPK